MSNIIVVGCGRVGSRLAMLSNYENNVCVIDRDPRAFASLGRDFNGATFAGVGYDEDVLMKAGIDECDFLAAVTQSDNVNLMVVEIARRLYDVPHAVARLYNTGHERAYLQLRLWNSARCRRDILEDLFGIGRSYHHAGRLRGCAVCARSLSNALRLYQGKRS